MIPSTRAALVVLLAHYERFAGDGATVDEAHHLAYLLHAVGEPISVSFTGHPYGPRADHAALIAIVPGLGEHVQDSAPLGRSPAVVDSGERDRAWVALRAHPGTADRVRRTLQLIEGLESPYGLELLTVTQWVWVHDPFVGDVVSVVRQWSPREERLFTEHDVRIAVDTLSQHGWAPTGARAPAAHAARVMPRATSGLDGTFDLPEG